MSDSEGCRVLDGRALADARADMIARRAGAVTAARGHAPRLLIVGFGDEYGRVPHVGRKLRAAVDVGIDVAPLIVPGGTGTSGAVMQMHAAIVGDRFDGVFVQFPFPADIDGDAFAAAIPAKLDVDVMAPRGVDRYMAGETGLPPVTVTAALLLLDAYGVSVTGRRGLVIGEESPFTAMFREALARRGAEMDAVLRPNMTGLARRVGEAGLVVVAAARPGIVRSESLAEGAVAVDVGYFNPGGRGDIDVSGGTNHLAALAPVPGGIGPMTVSALLERVVEFSESH